MEGKFNTIVHVKFDNGQGWQLSSAVIVENFGGRRGIWCNCGGRRGKWCKEATFRYQNENRFQSEICPFNRKTCIEEKNKGSNANNQWSGELFLLKNDEQKIAH